MFSVNEEIIIIFRTFDAEQIFGALSINYRIQPSSKTGEKMLRKHRNKLSSTCMRLSLDLAMNCSVIYS